jgi:hypothetical protein
MENKLDLILRDNIRVRELTKKDFKFIKKRLEGIKNLLRKQKYVDFNLLYKPIDI